MGKRSEHRDSRNLYPLKNFLVKLATLVVSLVLAFAAFLAYSAWRESRAAAAAHAFCDATVLGESAQSLMARAQAAEPSALRSSGNPLTQLVLMFTGTPP